MSLLRLRLRLMSDLADRVRERNRDTVLLEGLDNVMIRPGYHKDIPLITKSWYKGFRRTEPRLSIKAYDAYHHKVMEELLPRCDVRVLCNAESPDDVLGYLVGEFLTDTAVIHWVYVKLPFRRLGMAGHLVREFLSRYEGSPVAHTMLSPSFWHKSDTRPAKDLTQYTKSRGWDYNPYLLWASLSPGWHL